MDKNNELAWARRDPTTLRRIRPYDGPLPATLRWLESLPGEVRPLALLGKYPRIVNMLARTWNEPLERERYFNDLLVDKRGGRAGFPVDVLEDLLALRDYYLGRYPIVPSSSEHSPKDATRKVMCDAETLARAVFCARSTTR